MKILVALSGGIDSSTMAHMLAAEGHELIGVRFTLWTDPLAPAIAKILPSKCCNAQTASRAKATAMQLGIPYHIVDLEEEFKREVVDPFLEGYKKGLTPNPCIRCNRTIKFGKLLELMDEFSCDALATGHYARVAKETLSDGSERMLLLEAIDQAKDQSYYLYGLSQEQLKRVLFPLGAMQKSDVYELAKHFGVPYEEQSYRESQDLCFFPEKSPQDFLKRHLKDALTPGQIVRPDGTVIGKHDGLPLYTPGQRKGLGIGGLKIPLEVVGKNAATNHLIVEEKGKERTQSLTLHDLRWISWKPNDGEEIPFECRTRALSDRRRGMLFVEGSHGRFTFESPTGTEAPGQSLVLYRSEEVVGGGVIAE
ncbi:tRNA 2-thiouridine(34) synthase MnmA [Candidatus Peribacteria bacterium RIFCSPHIGHO2_02_FULL_52_16]|nr:MAG: tRNA 2-thiouridine(34) synthase MnmA [Candidatus Peribacteria bacterium RIFCSPHIGHO2_01_FULL_51_35]OGJ61208.1 MAG: tRNA 2-thiouridine(34) synthase MnmA [Candidatus Peribacteria bacterium RIFCSPHIGHO2_02_FULL_52_16]